MACSLILVCAVLQGGFAYDGLGDGLPVMRVDKDTVSDMGTVWEYKNSDGKQCCPASARPTIADKTFQVAQSSNCVDGGCYDPDFDTSDTCTVEYPCAGFVLSGVTTATGGLSVTLSSSEFSSLVISILDNVYTGLTIYFSSALAGLGTNAGVTNTAGLACGAANQVLDLVFTIPNGEYGGRAAATVTLNNNGDMTVNTATVTNIGQGFTVAPTVSCPSCLIGCTATFTAVLKTPTIAKTSKTIVGHRASDRTIFLDSVHANIAAVAATDVYYRISADSVSRSVVFCCFYNSCHAVFLYLISL
jgi:hypothetical protein